MDLLIELIVGILRSLFGDPVKPADTSQFSRKEGLTPKGVRGPYNYSGSDRPGTPPKTLEEILEEVRRQANEKKAAAAGGAKPPAAPVAQRTIPQAPVRKAESIEERTLQTSIQPLAPKAPPPVAKIAQVARLQPLAAATPAKTGTLIQLKPLDHVIQKENRPLREEAAVLLSPAAAAAELAASTAQRKATAVGPSTARPAASTSELNIIQALRSANSAERRMTARQAVILAEVIGPPRSRQPYRPRMQINRGFSG